MLDRIVGVPGHQMDHDPLQVLSADTEFSLERDHRALQWLETMKLLKYLLAAVTADTLLHAKCSQVSLLS